MKIYTYQCECGNSLAAIVELDSRAAGGYTVRFSDEPGTLVGIAAAEHGGRTCKVCARVISTMLIGRDGWTLLKPIENPKSEFGDFLIWDEETPDNPVPVDVIGGVDGVLWIRPHGYGDKNSIEGEGLPIGVGIKEGCLKVYLWDDINDEDHRTYDMEGARESAYKRDNDT